MNAEEILQKLTDHTSAGVLDAISPVLKQLHELERRVMSLEGYIFKRGHLTRAVRQTIDTMDVAFTANEIRDVVYQRFPDLKPIAEQHQISTIINRMDKAGEIVCIERGAGCKPNVYQRNGRPPHGAGRPGSRLGNKHTGESGFRSILRTALADPELPAEFTIKDIRAWVAKHAPTLHVPYGTWSSTLFNLQRAGELAEVVKDRPSGPFKIYRRGPRVVTATGGEPSGAEQAYRELRAEMNISTADLETTLRRAEESEVTPYAGPPPAQKRQYGALTQSVRAIPAGKEFTWRDVKPFNPGTQGLLYRLCLAGELECVRPARTGAKGWPATYKRKTN